MPRNTRRGTPARPSQPRGFCAALDDQKTLIPRRSSSAAPLAPPGTRALCLRGADVFVHVLCQHVERHVAAEDDAVVEGLDVVLLPESRLCLLALAVDLAVSNLVAARLARPRAVAIHFAGHFQRIRAVDVDEEAHALLARPALRVNAG